jgi:hypothetical protein
MEYYVQVDTIEQDGSAYNHLLRMVVKGKEYLISATTRHPLGSPGGRVWVTWRDLDCDTVHTLEQGGARIVTGQIKLCTAYGVEKK